MYITITSGQSTTAQVEKTERFLGEFLRRMKQLPGVIAIYPFRRPEKNDDTTIVIWENEEALKKYREGDLIKEVIKFERENNLSVTREGYPLVFAFK